jgi:hypothetical protein
MTQAILGSPLLVKICEAAGIDPSKTQRVILDVACLDVVHVYAQMIGTAELLDIDFSSQPMKVNILKKADGE